MIKLNLKADPYWIDLLPGVRVEVLPARTSLMLAAREDMAEPEDVTGDDPDGEEIAAKFDTMAYNVAVARRAIVSWQGIGDAAGKALPVTPESVGAAMEDYSFWLAFQSKYLAAAHRVTEEGND